MLNQKSLRRNDLITMVYPHGSAVILPLVHLFVCLVGSLVDRLKSGNSSVNIIFKFCIDGLSGIDTPKGAIPAVALKMR